KFSLTLVGVGSDCTIRSGIIKDLFLIISLKMGLGIDSGAGIAANVCLSDVGFERVIELADCGIGFGTARVGLLSFSMFCASLYVGSMVSSISSIVESLG
ncbi:hypothetical protein NPIL_491341, partial [Nephila pilipes]